MRDSRTLISIVAASLLSLTAAAALAQETPLLYLSSPRPHSVISGNVPLDVRCFATSTQACQRLCVEVRGRTQTASACIDRTSSSSPGTLMLLTRPFPAFESGEELTVTLSGNAGAGSEATATFGPLLIERSPKLVAVHRVQGSILDFDAARVLFLNQFQSLGVLDRASQQVSWLATLPQDPPGSTPTYGALTPSGAAIQSGYGRIFTSVDGVWTRITTGRLDAVNGDSLVWVTEDGGRAYAHTLSTGHSRGIWSRTGSDSPFQSDIAATGDIYYATHEEPFIRHLLVGTLGDHPGNLERPITDGTNVAGRWSDGSTSSSFLYTADGAEVALGDSIAGDPAGLLLHAGHAGFLRSDGDVNQVWLRTPDGELHQLSSFATSSQLDQQKLRVGHDGISDSGEVVFLNEGKRYIGRPGAAPEEISSALGHARWFDGGWYVTLGNTLFRVEAAGATAPPVAALRAGSKGLEGYYEEVVVRPIADNALEDEPALLRRDESDALPDLSDLEEASDLAGDAPDGAQAAAGCSAGGSAGPGGGAAAFAALAGLALARRRRRA
ncbi:MYXO-CTERM sorting domain-containing protein [Sorangium sp. So ce1504]|uniref:MYXO-CTERM sorting domain-containing protein n=1 Tax=Sorangium sp. So ce1504 TaxID=3133337 RepID=UPI003F5FE2D6